MFSSSYPNYPADQMFFVHLHVRNVPGCNWYSEEGGKFGLHPDALFAHACNRADAELNIQKLVVVGVPVIEGILIPCVSAELLTPEMQRVLNLA